MIVINDQFAIDSNRREWRICQHRSATEKSPESWEPIHFYGSLSGAIEALRGILIRTSEYESWAELERNVRGINKLLDKRFKVGI